MVNYLQTLSPPDYRNLVINPGGEPSIAATWVAGNGTVATGSTDVTAKSGTSSAIYTVTNSSSLSYQFGPLGPVDSSVHQSAFRIPGTRQVSARVSVRADRACWVRVQASWLAAASVATDGSQPVINLQPGTESRLFAEVAQAPAQAAVQIDANGWTTIEFQLTGTSVPTAATHWQPLISVYSSNPDDAGNAAAPAIGTRVYADEALILDSGASLAGVPFISGAVSGYSWEGTANYSSSRTTVAATEIPSSSAPSEVTGPVEQTETDDTHLDTAEAVSTPVVAPPETPAAAPTIEARDRLLDGQSAVAIAEDILTTRRDPRNLCLRSDVQLDSLIFNEMDDLGVVWIVTEIEGWWTTPEPDTPDQPRAWFDGSYDVRGRHQARAITLAGSFIPRHADDVSQARDRLIRACTLVHQPGWFMTHEDPVTKSLTKGSQVRLTGSPLISTVNVSGRTDFSISLRAPDPIKYGLIDGVAPGYETTELITSNSRLPGRPARPAGASDDDTPIPYSRQFPWRYPEAVFGLTQAVLNNRGNIEVSPKLTLYGPTAGPVRVYNADTAQTFTIIKKLYASEKLEIDCATKQVTLNGQGNFRFYLDIDVDWLYLQPGANRIYFSEDVISGTRTKMTVQWRSGWIG